MYYTYVLYSSGFDRIYIGQTNNLELRIERHNKGNVKSTKAYVPWKLVYFQDYSARSLAMKEEKKLKSHKGREFIRKKLLNGRGGQIPD